MCRAYAHSAKEEDIMQPAQLAKCTTEGVLSQLFSYIDQNPIKTNQRIMHSDFGGIFRSCVHSVNTDRTYIRSASK